MKKTLILFVFLTIFVVVLSGCNLIANKQVSAPAETKITYFVPTAETEKFCNGGDMDSEGFRNTITKKMEATIPIGNLNKTQLIKQTLIYAVNNVGLSITNTVTKSYLKIIGDTAYIQPIEGWAGVSIFLCYWKPYMEVNLLQFPEIKKVEWVDDNAEWQALIEE